MQISDTQWALIVGLPGEEEVTKGMRDLAAGKIDTTWALYLLQAKQRLIEDGLTCLADLQAPCPDDAHIQFYRRLEAEEEAGAHARYNSYNRLLCSFSSSLAARVRRQHAK